ncbi:phospholipase D-like domain-containing protein [Kaarinaea lacus]
MANRPKKLSFPWREGNRFKLLVDGDQFFPMMLDAIHKAKRFLLIEMYLVQSGKVADRFISAIIKAVQRGVNVYMLLDDFGAREFNKKDRLRLSNAGVNLSFYNPLHYGQLRRSLFRDHRKLLVADNKIAIVGGAGFTDEFDPKTSRKPWRETMVCIEGPNVVDWRQVFVSTWRRSSDEELMLPRPRRVTNAGIQAGRVAFSGRFGSQEIQRSFVKRVHTAERRVWMATAYFVPSWKLRRALRYAAGHNVDVRLLLPGSFTDHPGVRHAGRRFYARLLRAGVRIFEYQPRFLHTKALLCDDWSSIGSSNVDRWNLRWNLEGNQEIDDSGFADLLQEMFEADFKNSEECLYEEWRKRPWYQRWQEWIWGQVDLWLDNTGWRIKQRMRHARRQDNKEK